MVSLQGFGARILAIPDERIRSFESAINAITGSSTFMVSSPYRSDVLYNADRSYSEEIIHLWLLYADANETPRTRKNFFVTDTKKETLEAFFVRLVYLSSNRYWFNGYVDVLRRKLAERPIHKLAMELIRCQRFIKNEGIHRMFETGLASKESLSVIPCLSSDLLLRYQDTQRLN